MVLFFLFFILCCPFCVHAEEEKILNIYNWFSMIPQDLIVLFEKETGIKVNHDAYDTNEVLEAKLLAGNTGYDIVGPSAFPYLARQISADLYHPLQKEKIPNLLSLDPVLMEKMSVADPHNAHAIPLVWGVTALAYNEEKVKQLAPDAPLDSWALIFDARYASQLKTCRIEILEEAADVLIPVYRYFKEDLKDQSAKTLHKLLGDLLKIRPFIERFDAVRSHENILNGESCVVMQWAGSVEYARNALKSQKNSSKIKVVIPKEGTSLWIDCLAIPKNAPHPDNAHRFLDFILRPEIIARVSNYTFFGNGIPASLPFIQEDIRKNPVIFPSSKVMERAFMNEPTSPQHQRLLNRMMTRFRTGR